MPKPVSIHGQIWMFPDEMSNDEIRSYVLDKLHEEKAKDLTHGFIPDLLMGTARGLTNTIGEDVAAGLGLFSNDAANYVRRAVDENRRHLFGIESLEMPETVGSKVGDILGNLATYVAGEEGLKAAGLGAKGVRAAMGLMGAGAGAEEQHRRQLQHLAETGERVDSPWSTLGGAALGALGTIPAERLISRGLDPMSQILEKGLTREGLEAATDVLQKGAIRDLAGEAAKQAALQGGIGAGVQFGQNVVSRLGYDPNQQLGEGVGQAALMGAGIGGVTGPLFRLAGRATARSKYADDVAAVQEAIKNGASPEDALTAIAAKYPELPGQEGDKKLTEDEMMAGQRERTEEDPYGLGNFAFAPRDRAAETTPIQTPEKPGEPAPISDNLFNALWRKVEAGDVEAKKGETHPLLQAAKAVRDEGGLETPEDFRAMVDDYAAIPADADHQQAMRELTEKHMPEPEPELDEPAPITGFRSSNADYRIVGRGTQRTTGKGDIFAPSSDTVFVTPETRNGIIDRLRQHAKGGTTAVLRRVGDQLGLLVRDRDTGRLRHDLSETLPFTNEPEVGLHPVELWKNAGDGDAGYSLGSAIEDLHTDEYPEVESPQITPYAQEQAKAASERMGPMQSVRNVGLRMLQGIFTPDGKIAEGRWNPTRKLIDLALVHPMPGESPEAHRARWEKQIARALDHEFVHFLRHSDVFSPEQWKSLLREAKRRGLLDEAQRMYGGRPDYNAEKVSEESVANLLGDTANQGAPNSFVQRQWNRVVNMFGKVRNGLTGQGWFTADDVINAIRSGAIARQEPAPSRSWKLTPQARPFLPQRSVLLHDMFGVNNQKGDHIIAAVAKGANSSMLDPESAVGKQLAGELAARGLEHSDVVGTSGLTERGDVAQRHGLGVDPDFRGVGVAEAMKDYASSLLGKPVEDRARLTEGAPRRAPMFSLSREEQYAPETPEPETPEQERGRYQVNRWWQSQTGPERKEDGYVVVDSSQPPVHDDGVTPVNREVSRVFKTRQGAENHARRMNGNAAQYSLSREEQYAPDTYEHPFGMGTRVPTAVSATESGMSPDVLTSYESAQRDPAMFRKNVEALRKSVRFRDIKDRNPQVAAEKMINRMKENLLWMHDNIPEAIRNRARLWYDGANRIAKKFARDYDVSTPQASAVLAVFSPQKDWFQNVGMAERMLRFWKNRDTHEWDPGMNKVYRKIKAAKDATDRKRALRKGLEFKPTPGTVGKAYRAIRGKKFSEITDPSQRALWFRLHDEAINPRDYQIISPEGDFTGTALKKDKKTPAKLAWSSYTPIKKALSVLEHGTPEAIHLALGNEHKVRNFYHNILTPNSERGYLTMDTHAVAAAMLRALAGKSTEVKQNFGGAGSASSSISGESGTYGLIGEAYRRAAAARDMLPREMQSITWEGIRGLFQPEFKSQAKNVQMIDRIWNNVRRGKISRDDAYNQIYEAAGKITSPDWYVPDTRGDGTGQAAADTGAVSGNRPAGRGPGRVSGRGGGSAAARGVPAPGLLEGVRYSLAREEEPERSMHVGLKLGAGSPLFRKYGSETSIPTATADRIYDSLADKLGVDITGRKHSMGIFEGVREPSTHLLVKGSPDKIDDYMHALSYVLQQTATIATRPQKGGNGYWLEIRQNNGRHLADGQFAMNLANRIREIATDDPEFKRPDGSHVFEEPAQWGGTKSLVSGASAVVNEDGRPAIRLYNDHGVFSPEQLGAIHKILTAKLGDEYKHLDLDIDHGQAEFRSAYNDWEAPETANGEGFKDHNIRRNGQVFQSFLDDTLRPLVDQALDKRAAAAGTGAEAARGRAAEAAVPEDVRYSLERGQRPPPEKEGPRSDRILDLAGEIRSGRAVDSSQHDPADLAAAQKLAAYKNVDPEVLRKINPSDYMRFDKLDLNEQAKEHLKNYVRLAAHLGGWDPKTKLPFREIERQSMKLLGGDVLDVPQLKKGEVLNPAVRLAMTISQKELESELIRRTKELAANRDTMSPEAQAQAQREIDGIDTQIRKLGNVLIPARTNAGRALVYYRIMAQGTLDTNYWHARIKRMLNIPGHEEIPDEIRKPIDEALRDGQDADQDLTDAKRRFDEAQRTGDQKQQEEAEGRVKTAEQRVMKTRKKFAQEVTKHDMTSASEGWNSLWKTGLLTNPVSRIVDVMSNAALAGMERVASVPADWADSFIAQTTGNKQLLKQFGRRHDVAARIGWKDGYKRAAAKWGEIVRGEVTHDPSELANKLQMTGKRLYLGPGMQPAADYLQQKYINRVMGTQELSDIPFRQRAYHVGLSEFAQLRAMQEHKENKLPAGLTMAQRAEQLTRNPDKELQIQAEGFKEMMSFANENIFSRGFRSLKRSVESDNPLAARALDYIFPFVKVPSNVFLKTFDYSPVGLGRGAYRALANRFAKQALSPEQQREYARLIGRGMVGSALMMLGYGAASKGLMTGTRDYNDTNGRMADEAAGRPPGSFRIPGTDRWVQIGRMAPFGNLLAAGASLWQMTQEGRHPMDMLTAGGGVLTKSVLEMPLMMGYDMFSDALKNPQSKMQTWAKRQIGSIVPSGIAQLAAATDPLARDLKDDNYFSDLLNRVHPQSLPARTDVLGRPVRRPGAIMPLTEGSNYTFDVGTLLDPFRGQHGYDDDVTRAILRDRPTLGKARKEKDEDNRVYLKRAELAGELSHRGILEAIQSGAYGTAESADERRKTLEQGRRNGLAEMKGLLDDTYKESTPTEKLRMLDEYLSNLRAYSAR